MPKGKSGIKRGGKGSSGKTSAASIPVAATIAEANALAVSLGLAKHADFGKMDVSVANEMIRAIAETYALKPNLEQLEFIGSTREMAKLYHIKKPKGAYACYYPGLNSMCMVESHYLPKSLEKTKSQLKFGEEIQFRPVGTASIKGIIDHEIGHWIGNTTNANKDERIIQLHTQHKGPDKWVSLPSGGSIKKNPMSSLLSTYANTNVREFLAEAWSEYRNNPNPRPLAKEVGDIIMSSYIGGGVK